MQTTTSLSPKLLCLNAGLLLTAFGAGWMLKPAAAPLAAGRQVVDKAAPPGSMDSPPIHSILAPAAGGAAQVFSFLNRLPADDEAALAFGKLWLGRWSPPQPVELAWADALALPDGPWRDAVLERIWPELEKSDPTAAWQESFRLSTEASFAAREGLIQHQLDAGAAPADFAALLATTPDSEKEAAASAMIAGLTHQSPEAGAALLASISDESLRANATIGFAAAWAATAPEAAADWCLKNSSAEGAGIAAVLQSWCQTDAPAASAWLSKLPAGPARDQGAFSLIESLSVTDPDLAWKWTEHLSDPAARKTFQDRLTLASSVAVTNP